MDGTQIRLRFSCYGVERIIKIDGNIVLLMIMVILQKRHANLMIVYFIVLLSY